MTTPAVLLSAGSAALADANPSAQTQLKPTFAELKKAADDADEAYKRAVAAKEAEDKKIEETLKAMDKGGSHPLRLAALAADKEAEAAKSGKAAADKAVTDAKAKLAEAVDEAAKAAAQKELAAAETAAGKAAQAVTEADAKSKAAWDALTDARVEAFRELGKAQRALDEARKAKKTANDAFAAAKECIRVPGLTVLADNLPSKVVAGTTVDFSFTVANNTDRTLDVDPLVFFNLRAKNDQQHFMKVQWSDGSGWKELDSKGHSYTEPVKGMKPGSRADVKMRMTIEAGVPAKEALALFAGDASDQYNPCVLGPMKRYDFEVLPAGSKPGKVDDAKPGKVDDKDRKEPGKSAQGGNSAKPVPGAGDDTSAKPTPAGGSLASTGASSAVPQLALAGGAAVLLGAGAVFAARRRGAKTGN
ncbi:hypothetical protein ACH4OW_11365 [Streptomyces sp. NPDC017056]|uniref:hypothetical protein n=1 Tax=Streptomyces sp. NPDC017056 TaxID=3364973 RepID=UPI00378F5BE3